MSTNNDSLPSSAKSRIGIDCRMWDETGVGRYIRNIVTQISKMDTQMEYVLFFLPKNMETQDFPPNFRKVSVDIRWHTFAEQIRLPFIYWQQNLDLLFVPHFNAPILYPKKFIATIHDLTILRVKTGRATTLPYPLYLLKRLGYKLNVLNTIYRAKTIFTVSNSVREDLIKSFKLSKKDITVSPCAVSSKFRPISSEESLPVLQKYSIKKPYLFYVGNAHPHKNLEALIEAFKFVSQDRLDLTLVLGGKKEYFFERLEKEVKETPLEKRIVFTGFIDDADLPALYSQTESFVNPSLYEGFGIQLLEAFACGAKVICSNTTSLPEVGGESAFYFDPRNPQDIATKILESLEISHNKELGFAQAQKFSWEDSAKIIMQKMHESLQK